MIPSKLAKALRAKADSIANHPTLREGDQDAAELILVLARIVEGKSIDRAFGAPGDWGYGTPIGDGILAMLREPLVAGANEMEGAS